jgi:hypothetical protein
LLKVPRPLTYYTCEALHLLKALYTLFYVLVVDLTTLEFTCGKELLLTWSCVYLSTLFTHVMGCITQGDPHVLHRGFLLHMFMHLVDHTCYLRSLLRSALLGGILYCFLHACILEGTLGDFF